ncbi:MAG: membrane protein insertase YidC [Actinobacteria bacterium]|nr:membrane protein insertase YidC [Actinomycetota bacterium]
MIGAVLDAVGASGVFFWWQPLLNGLGSVLAWLYDLIPNFGVAIILLTVGIRLVLLPLGIKQIRSMHAMQALQPRIKALQTKYKGNKQKLSEETMRLYREHGVNPLSGCWPLLLQLPILIALYSVLRFPQQPLHLPAESELWSRIEVQFETGREQGGTSFLGMNMLCNPVQAGTGTVEVSAPPAEDGEQAKPVRFDCGSGIPIRLPYYALALLMVGTTFYQQKQMQKASPGGGSQQQQTLTRVMPLLFGVWGFLFPSGLVLYWTVSNAWQIGQQHFIIKARQAAEGTGPVPPVERRPSGRPPARGGQQRKGAGRPQADRRGTPAGRGGADPRSSGARPSSGKNPAKSPPSGRRPAPPRKKGLLGSMIERAEAGRARRLGRTPSNHDEAGDGGEAGDSGDSGAPGDAGGPGAKGAKGGKHGKGGSAGMDGSTGGPPSSSAGGRSRAGDRKKRRKR